MKLNTLIVAAVFASTTFSSCVFKTAGENQLKNTHTSLVDGDAYAFFRNVGTIAPYEVSYAEHVSKVGSPQAKEAASQVSKFFSEILPEMDELATQFHVDFPVLGTAKYQDSQPVNQEVLMLNDSTNVEDSAVVVNRNNEISASTYSDDAYLHHIQDQLEVVKVHFARLTRNTNKELRTYAQSKTEAIAELNTAIGGKEDAHAHH